MMSRDAIIAEALGEHRAGRLDVAEAAYRRLLAIDDGDPDANHYLGILLKQRGREDEALVCLGRAVAARPGEIKFRLNQALVLHEAARFAEAEAAFRAALAIDPMRPEAYLGLGVAVAAQGRYSDAEGHFRQVLAQVPDHADAAFNLGIALRGQGRRAEAADILRRLPASAKVLSTLLSTLLELGDNAGAAEVGARLVAIVPEAGTAHFGLARALDNLGRLVEAVAAYRRAVEVDPALVAAWSCLGMAESRLGRFEAGAAAFRRAVEFDPDCAENHYNWGRASQDAGDPAAAEGHYRRALALDPGYPAASLNLGVVLRRLDRAAEAEAIYRNLLAAHPDHVAAHTNLAAVLLDQSRFDEAEKSARAALAAGGDADAHGNLGGALVRQGRAAEAFDSYAAAVAAAPPAGAAGHFRNMLFTAVYRDDLDAERMGALHREFGRLVGGRRPLAVGRRPGGGRIRLGYLSSDLRMHPVATNMLPVIRAHDRSAFEIHFYSIGAKADEVTDTLRGLADGWRDVSGLSDEAAARLIHSDGIDILVCLAARFDDNRPEICGWRPAPVQISLHDGATSGLAEMDYIIGDRWLLPRHTSEFFSERRLRMPQFYVADLPAGLPPPPAAPRSGAPVFCCFNGPAKISPSVLAAWGRILAALPTARLVLKYHEHYRSAPLRERMLAAMTAAGARPDQVAFIADRDEGGRFLARYNEVDIALDTFPFCGSTTSFQSLAMGVPVVTWAQPRMISRWTAAMVSALGMEELIAASAEDYVARAIAAAGSIESWRSRRGAIRAALATSRLCDSGRWTRHLERLYRAVWRRV